MSIEKSPQNEKQMLWDSKMAELEKITDLLGQPIDGNIKETVAALNLIGFPTDSSCGGHIDDEGLRFPYLGGKAVGRPKYRYIDDEKLRKSIAEKYNVDPDEVPYPREETESYMKANDEYWDYVQENKPKETDEYAEWMKRNDVFETDLEKLIDEFYKSNQKSDVVFLQTAPIYPGYRIECIGRDIGEILKEKDPEEIKSLIEQAQREIESFGNFVKNRFFESS